MVKLKKYALTIILIIFTLFLVVQVYTGYGLFSAHKEFCHTMYGDVSEPDLSDLSKVSWHDMMEINCRDITSNLGSNFTTDMYFLITFIFLIIVSWKFDM